MDIIKRESNVKSFVCTRDIMINLCIELTHMLKFGEGFVNCTIRTNEIHEYMNEANWIYIDLSKN